MNRESEGKTTIATIYGPVGCVVQEPGKPPQIQLGGEWQKVAELINRTISAERAIVGPDRIARVISANLSGEDLSTIDAALSEASQGDLYLVADQSAS